MSQRHRALIAGLVIGAQAFTACGGDTDPSPPPPPPAVVPVANVTLSPTTGTLVLDETLPFTATARDAAGNPLPGRVVDWTSSASGIATVNSAGLVTAIAVGEATITASIEGKAAQATVAVKDGGFRVAGGLSHTLAITSGGVLRAWGTNTAGQLGDGTVAGRLSPMPTGTGATWRSVVAGRVHTVALKSDGTLWTWGSNAAGQLGDGSTTNRPAPSAIGLAATWRSVAAGDAHTIAIRSDGTLWAWGSNQFGRLGNGTPDDRLTPTQIGTGTTWTAIAAGGSHSIALNSDGTLWAWGNNGNGQLGDGTIVSRSTPTLVTGGAPWTAIAAGAAFTLALRADGTLWAWGHNGLGQLGDGSATGPINQSRPVPSQIGTGAAWRLIAAGANHGMAITADGTLWTWGHNLGGQLGDGTSNNIKASPAQVGTATTWNAVAGGVFHTIARQSNGTFWTWGYNGFGQLGDGTNSDRPSPVPIAF